MTEETPAAAAKGMVPSKPFYAICQNANTASLYDNNPKRIMYIGSCEECRFKIEGAEDGGRLFDPRGEGIEEEHKWYYCTHPSFTGWPKRIGQLDKCKETPYFCPLESLVKLDDNLIKVEEEKGRKRGAKAKSEIETHSPSTPENDQ